MNQNANKKLSPAAAMIILVCVMIIFTISLLYISNQKTTTTNQENNNIENTNIQIETNKEVEPENSSEPVTTTYTNSTYNFTLDFSKPYKSATLVTDNGSRIDFTFSDWKASMLIEKSSNLELFRSTYEIGQEDDITINGLPATRIIGSSLKDASITYIYLITKGDRLFALYSTSANIQNVAKTLSFTK